MQPIDQITFINRWEDQLENQLKQMVDLFQNLPASTLLQPSANGGWSIAECVEHLNTYAEYYLPRIKKVIDSNPEINHPAVYSHSWIGNYFINMMDATQSNKKYKAIKKHRPVTIQDPHEVLANFIQHMEDLLLLLKTAKKKELIKIKVATSLASFIKLNAGDAIQFLLTHNNRHILQARQNLVA